MKEKPYDLKTLIELNDEDNSLIAQMLEIFIRQTKLSLKEISEMKIQNKWKEIGFIVHKIKPSLIVLNYNEIISEVDNICKLINEDKNTDQVLFMLEIVENVLNNSMTLLENDLKNYQLNS